MTPARMAFPLALIGLLQDETKLKDWIDLGATLMIESGTADRIVDQYDPQNFLFLRAAKNLKALIESRQNLP